MYCIVLYCIIFKKNLDFLHIELKLKDIIVLYCIVLYCIVLYCIKKNKKNHDTDCIVLYCIIFKKNKKSKSIIFGKKINYCIVLYSKKYEKTMKKLEYNIQHNTNF